MWTVKSKKLKENLIFFGCNIDKCFDSLQNSSPDDIVENVAQKKNNIDAPKCYFQTHLEASILFFCDVFHECHFMMKFCKLSKFLSMFHTNKIRIFLILLFTQAHMSSGLEQHFRECVHHHSLFPKSNYTLYTLYSEIETLDSLTSGLWEGFWTFGPLSKKALAQLYI